MKIISYNISRYNRTKLDHILTLGADVYVLPECACGDIVGNVPGYRLEWMGDFNEKGLGILIKDIIKYEIPEWFDAQGKYMMPVIVGGEFLLLASWPTALKGETQTYPQILLECLKKYEPYIRQWKTLICGDFNCYIGQGGVSRRTGTFEQCIEFMKGLGLESLYHKRTGEDFGKESKATYYHLFKENSPFFLDYAFTNMEAKSFEIGEWNRNISDHCALVMEMA